MNEVESITGDECADHLLFSIVQTIRTINEQNWHDELQITLRKKSLGRLYAFSTTDSQEEAERDDVTAEFEYALKHLIENGFLKDMGDQVCLTPETQNRFFEE